jgi:hypothetical protein
VAVAVVGAGSSLAEAGEAVEDAAEEAGEAAAVSVNPEVTLFSDETTGTCGASLGKSTFFPVQAHNRQRAGKRTIWIGVSGRVATVIVGLSVRRFSILIFECLCEKRFLSALWI